ncbi:hypothetical protein HZH68_007935 [Vespula germanica]|uniref:Uncharacterized protein n=1 Tax=Vespula germanica TaxID=30212 RepID=A0A834K3A4_VESGE|nr:hypothetical protein HZH68_007935 [Vespula germanica]
MVAIEKEEEAWKGKKKREGKDRRRRKRVNKEFRNSTKGFVRTKLRPRSSDEEGKSHRPIFELNLLGLPVLPTLKSN